EKVLDGAQAEAIGNLARRIHDHVGKPQDIEWAIDGGSVWLLQSRPVTTLAAARPETIAIPIVVPPGTWTRDTFHQPVPASPLGKVALTEQIAGAFPSAFAEFGILMERLELVEIGGWVYSRMKPVGGPPAGTRGRSAPPPRWLLALLMRLHPAIRRRTRAA